MMLMPMLMLGNDENFGERMYVLDVRYLGKK